MRFKATDRYISLLFLIVSLSLLPSTAFGWGSMGNRGRVDVVSTHEYIITQAYDRMDDDPAFDVAFFLPVAQIRANEGVDTGQNGPGPDGNGNSNYDEHYYNSSLNIPGVVTGAEGKAPYSTGRHAAELAISLCKGAIGPPQRPGRPAAYAAHYLADMWVPWHTMGVSGSTADALFTSAGGAKAKKLILHPSAYGDLDMCYRCATNHNTDFLDEMKRFRAARTAAASVNWFDPWYFNGYTAASSSHIMWEGAYYMSSLDRDDPNSIANQVPLGLDLFGDEEDKKVPPYDRRWKNSPDPSFAGPTREYGKMATSFALAIAANTRSRYKHYFKSGQAALKGAIVSVATLWRGSYSGLRPEMKTKPDQDGKIRITGQVENKAIAEATGVKVRIKLTGGKIVEPEDPKDQVLDLGSIPKETGKVEIKDGWLIEKTDKKCTVTLEVIGKYPDTCPDLQYAAILQPLKADWPRVYDGKGKLSLTINCPRTKSQSIGYTENFPIKFQLEAPPESGPAKATGEAEFNKKLSGNACLNARVINKKQKVYYKTGTHDGVSKYKMTRNGKSFGGTFNETSLKGIWAYQLPLPVHGGRSILIDFKVSWDLPLKSGGGKPEAGAGESSKPPSATVNKLRSLFKKSKIE